jgi:NTE family protein
MLMSEPVSRPKIGLILTGGGARAAYQVGVLHAIAEMLPRGSPNPFPIICGTSAGAINAAAMAAGASDFHRAVSRLMLVWKNFHVYQVYRSDFIGVFGQAAKWLLSLVLGGLAKNSPVSLLDNSPLARLLGKYLEFDGIGKSIDSGALHAVSVTASGYTSGQSVSFFQGARGAESWRRARRIGVASPITLDHLMASSALPFIFPAVRIHREYFGDGSMRQVAPISPALHLGAERVLVIGTSRGLNAEAREREKTTAYPSLAQIAGHALNSIFLDGLELDIERMQRINNTVRLITPEQRARHRLTLREVDVLVLSPSEEIDLIAEKFVAELPAAVRFLLRGIGATRRGGSTLVSYLLFERSYCRALMDMGYRDTLARRDEILGFLGAALPVAA